MATEPSDHLQGFDYAGAAGFTFDTETPEAEVDPFWSALTWLLVVAALTASACAPAVVLAVWKAAL